MAAKPEGKRAVLFLCTGNSARSQMAEGFARKLAAEKLGSKVADRLEIYSAGTEPKGVHPMALRAMAEAGCDISRQTSKGPESVPLGRLDRLVTLCGDARDRCPSLPVSVEREHWPLEDPARAEGSEEERLAVFRKVRDEVRERVEELLDRIGREEA